MWELLNQTPYAGARGFARDADGGEVWVVLAQASFSWGQDGRLLPLPIQPSPDLVPVLADDPRGAILLRDAALVPDRPGSEILIAGSACAPGGRAVTTLGLSAAVGHWHKRLRVQGDRDWVAGAFGPSLSAPRPFLRVALDYRHALGGCAPAAPGESAVVHPANPVGTGFALRRSTLSGQSAPNLEVPGATAEDWQRPGLPAGFGPIARDWAPRRQWAGTFDDAWARARAPLLPLDFDPRFWFSAPQDQWLPDGLAGGEPVTLDGFDSAGPVRFHLPALAFTCQTLIAGRWQAQPMRLHTVRIDTDAREVSTLWHGRLRCHEQDHLIERSVLRLGRGG